MTIDVYLSHDDSELAVKVAHHRHNHAMSTRAVNRGYKFKDPLESLWNNYVGATCEIAWELASGHKRIRPILDPYDPYDIGDFFLPSGQTLDIKGSALKFESRLRNPLPTLPIRYSPKTKSYPHPADHYSLAQLLYPLSYQEKPPPFPPHPTAYPHCRFYGSISSPNIDKFMKSHSPRQMKTGGDPPYRIPVKDLPDPPEAFITPSHRDSLRNERMSRSLGPGTIVVGNTNLLAAFFDGEWLGNEPLIP